MLYRGRAGTRGFTLIELAIVLGITGLLFTGLWRLLSNGNQQLRDQATASQQQQLITAINTYLATTDGQSWMGTVGASANVNLPLPPAGSAAGTAACKTYYDTTIATPTLDDLCTILPPGFNATTVSPYGQIYNIHVLKDGTPAGTAPQSYSFMIVTSGGDTIPDTDGGRISSMIGGDGGFIYSNSVCGAAPVNHWACGAYGAWAQDITVNYGMAAFAVSGVVASRTYYSPTQSSLQPWLARQQMPGDTTFGYNTMAWDFFVSGNLTGGLWAPYNLNLVPTGGLPAIAGATGANINMGGALSGTPGGTGVNLEVANTTGGGAINMAGGTINMAAAGTTTGGNTLNGALNLQAGTINMVKQDPGPGVTITTGGGVFNLQGGEIIDVTSFQTRNAININTGGAALDNGNTPGAVPLVSLGTNCTVDPTNLLISNVNDTNCAQGLSVTGDEGVAGRLTANSLYAQTFIYESSDMRLKTNIHTLRNSLDDIMKLNPVDFTFKATGQESLGVIAQDVEKIYPQLVSVKGDGMKAVNYDGLIAPLIGAVQELKKENDDLRAQLRVQAIRQDELERQLKDSSTSR